MNVLPTIDDDFSSVHVKRYRVRVVNKLNKWINGTGGKKAPTGKLLGYLTLIRDEVNKKDDSLLICGVDGIKNFLNKVQPYLGLKCVRNACPGLKKIFNYNGFVSKSSYGGKELMERIVKKVRICPYCNAEPIYRVVSKNKQSKVYKTAFDHFYPRSSYPFLGISLYNLVPSCERCNSKFKREFDPNGSALPHPYADDYIDKMNFVPVFGSSVSSHGREFVDIKGLKFEEKNGESCKQGVKHEEVFSLSDVYSELYTQDASDAVWKAIEYPKTYFEDKCAELKSANLPVHTIERLFYGASLDKKMLDGGRLSKMIIDITDQYRVRA